MKSNLDLLATIPYFINQCKFQAKMFIKSTNIFISSKFKHIIFWLQQACGKYIPAGSTVQGNQTGVAMDGTYLVEASF